MRCKVGHTVHEKEKKRRGVMKEGGVIKRIGGQTDRKKDRAGQASD